jgi:hypothetical protein
VANEHAKRAQPTAITIICCQRKTRGKVLGPRKEDPYRVKANTFPTYGWDESEGVVTDAPSPEQQRKYE